MPRTVGGNDGFGRSDVLLFTIPSGATGSAVNPIDFGRGYALFAVFCDDCTGFADAAKIKAQIGYDDGDNLKDLYEVNDPGTLWQKDTPTSGTLACMLTHAFGAQRLRFVADIVTTTDVVLKVIGYDPTVDG